MKELHDIFMRLEPADILAALVPELKNVMTHLDDEAKADFVIELLGGAEGDKLSSLVDL